MLLGVGFFKHLLDLVFNRKLVHDVLACADAKIFGS